MTDPDENLGENADSSRGTAGIDASEAMLLVYDELRALAHSRMAKEDAGHTLQATALVHEVYLRLSSGAARFADKGHFFYAAADAMRRILIEHARRKGRLKRGKGGRRVPLHVLDLATLPDSEEILAYEEAIRRLEQLMPQAGKVVRLRFYAGLSAEEAAEVMSISIRTVHREWSYARAWLYRALYGES